MSEKTLANEILFRVRRHFDSKNWTRLVTKSFLKVLHYGTFSVTKANMASADEDFF